MLTATANDLPLQHPLEYFRDKTLTLHLVLYIQVVPETWLNQIFQKDEQEFLSIWLLANVEPIRYFVY